TAAHVAHRQRRLGDPLANFEDAPALEAFIFVGRHPVEATWGGLIVSRRHGLWLILSALVLVAGCSNAKEAEKRAEVQKLQALAESRRWDEAVVSYRKALELPTLTIPETANQNLGLALYHLKQYREAEQTLRFAISLDPKMQTAYYNLGLVFIAENRRDEAKAAFRQA